MRPNITTTDHTINVHEQQSYTSDTCFRHEIFGSRSTGQYLGWRNLPPYLFTSPTTPNYNTQTFNQTERANTSIHITSLSTILLCNKTDHALFLLLQVRIFYER